SPPPARRYPPPHPLSPCYPPPPPPKPFLPPLPPFLLLSPPLPSNLESANDSIPSHARPHHLPLPRQRPTRRGSLLVAPLRTRGRRAPSAGVGRLGPSAPSTPAAGAAAAFAARLGLQSSGGPACAAIAAALGLAWGGRFAGSGFAGATREARGRC